MIEKFGRRKLFIIASAFNITSLIAFVLFSQLRRVADVLKYLCVLAICCHGISYSFATGPIAWFITAELVPTQYRSTCQSIALSVNHMMAFALTLFVLPLYDLVDSFALLILLVIPTAIALFVLYLWLPETRARDIQQVISDLQTGNIGGGSRVESYEMSTKLLRGLGGVSTQMASATNGVVPEQFEGLEAILNNAKLSDAAMEEAIRLLYGKRLPQLAFDKSLLEFTRENDFDLQGYCINAQPEQCRDPRKVTVAAIQNQIVLPTSAPINEQRHAIHQRVGLMIETAARAGAQIICMQEAWTMPFAFCTRERLPWTEFAESAENGPTTKFLTQLASKHSVVIISSILERDEEKDDSIWNKFF
uniref:Major facilitator superfamily (MFS) profile domain-containing protein n=1 Tax=Ditylenchus dipsaci TaxID=166011 RepID=A0A915DVX1_9BILA